LDGMSSSNIHSTYVILSNTNKLLHEQIYIINNPIVYVCGIEIVFPKRPGFLKYSILCLFFSSNSYAKKYWVKNYPYYRFAWHVEGLLSKRCRLSWLINSALVYEPKCGGGSCGVSANEYSCKQEPK
jgi:hypothetical protein